MESENTSVDLEDACLKDAAQNIGFSIRRQAMEQVILPLKEESFQTHPTIQQNMSHQNAIDFQKDEMETVEMYYYEQDYQQVAKRLFQINDNLELLCQDANKFSIRDMARKSIPRIIKTANCLKYLDKASNQLHEAPQNGNRSNWN